MSSPTHDLQIYLIRHGETAWSLTGRHTSRTDLPLTPHGEAQSRHLGERLRLVTFSHVLTSPRLRARQTAEGIGWPAAQVTVEPDLVEWDYGDYEGRTSADIRRDRPGWNLFTDGCPGGDSPAAVSDRADRLLARLRALGGTIALCSHGHFGRVLGARWIGLPVAHAQQLLLGAASISVLGHEHGSGAPAIALWNAQP